MIESTSTTVRQTQPLSARRVLWLMLCLKSRIYFNRIFAAWSAMGKKKQKTAGKASSSTPSLPRRWMFWRKRVLPATVPADLYAIGPEPQPVRRATPRRKRGGWVLAAVVTITFLSSGVNLSYQALQNLERPLLNRGAPVNSAESVLEGIRGQLLQENPDPEFSRGVTDAVKVIEDFVRARQSQERIVWDKLLQAPLLLELLGDRKEYVESFRTRMRGLEDEHPFREKGDQYQAAALRVREKVGEYLEGAQREFAARVLAVRREILPAAAFVVTLLGLALVVMAFGLQNTDLTRLELDVEWFLSLPVGAPWIYAAKIVERTVLLPLGWFTVGPFLWCTFWYLGYRWSLPLLTLGLTLVVHFVVALAISVSEVLLRRTFRAHGLRNVQAVCAIAGPVLLILPMSLATGVAREGYFVVDWALAAGPACAWLPTGLAVGIFAPGGGGALALLVAELGLVGAAGWAVIRWAARRGLEVTQGGYIGRRGKLRPARVLWFGGILGKDLLLLFRDRRVLVQGVFVPLLLMGMQLLFYPGILRKALDDPVMWGTLGVAFGAYALLVTAPSVLIHEGQALWILFSVPKRLDRVVLEKAAIWIGLAALYSLVAIGIGVFRRAGLAPGDLWALLWVVAGLPLLGWIGASLGVLGSDPLAAEPQHRMRLDIMYLFLLLGSISVGGLYLPGAWPKVVLLGQFAILGLALWQKVLQRSLVLLDPTAVPPRTVDLADGLIAVVLFFVLQSVAMVIAVGGGLPPGVSLFVGFAAAGALTVAMVFYTLWRHDVKLRGQLGFWGSGWLQALGRGVLGGAAAAAIAAVYLKVVLPLFPAAEPSTAAANEILASWLFPLLAVVAAPLVEEILFRGLVFRGMRRMMGFLPAALASAALFAVVHPPVSVAPVFVLGVVAAWAYERSGLLLAPIVAHAVYNAVVVSLQ